MNSLHDFSSWLSIMFSRHDFLSKSNDLYVFSSCSSSCFSSCFSLCFSSCFSSCFSLCSSSWLSTKSLYQTAFMIFRHDFLSWLFFMTFLHSFSSWLFYHDFSTIAFLHDFLSYSLHVSRHDFYQKDNAKR